MTPLGWGWALFVWGYALAWFLVNDRVKLIAYWALDWIGAISEPNARSEAPPAMKVAPKPDAGPQTPAAPLRATGLRPATPGRTAAKCALPP
jgi:H+-transporting ATPase